MGSNDGGRRRKSEQQLEYEWQGHEESPMDGPPQVAEDGRPMDYRLLADDDAWVDAGEELKRLDPGRYLAILAVVQDIVAIYRDPIRARRQATGNFVFHKLKDQHDLE